jgi:hypothetical protein
MKDLSTSKLCATTLCKNLEVTAKRAVFMLNTDDDKFKAYYASFIMVRTEENHGMDFMCRNLI